LQLKQCGGRLTCVDGQSEKVRLGFDLEMINELYNTDGQSPNVDRENDTHPIGFYLKIC
jgi:hypothetical protein